MKKYALENFNLKKNDLIIIRFAETIEQKELDEIINTFAGCKLPEGVNFVLLRKDFGLEILPEDVMNNIGWYRKQ
jgi:hypothetical protein